MSTAVRLVINAATSWTLTVLRAASGLILVPFLLAQLGKDGYGLATLVGVIVSLALLADVGVRQSLGRHLAEMLARGDRERYDELVSGGMAFYLAVGVIAVLLCAVGAPSLAVALNVSDPLLPQAIFLIRFFGGPAILVTLVFAVYASVLDSHGRFDLINYAQGALSLVRLIGYLLVLGLTDTGLYGWAAVSLVAVVVELVVLRRLALRLEPEMRIRFGRVQRGTFAQLFSVGGLVFVIQLTQTLNQRSDPFILSIFKGTDAVALYNPAIQLAVLLRPIINTLAQQMHPFTTRYHVSGQTALLQTSLIRGTRYTFLMGVLACVVMGVFAYPICFHWLSGSIGEEYQATARVLMLWAGVELLMYGAGVQWAVLLGMEKLKYLAVVQVPTAIISVIAKVVLVQYPHLGLTAVVMPTLLIEIFRRPLIGAYTARLCGLSPLDYFRLAYWRPLCILALLMAVAIPLHVFGTTTTLVGLLGSAAGVSLLWAGACWWFGFTDEDRRSFLNLRDRALQKFRRPRVVPASADVDSPGQAMVEGGGDEDRSPMV